MSLFGSTIDSLHNGLNYASVKNNAISTNVANVDTPGYKTKDVVFKDVLNEELDSNLKMKQTNPKHLGRTASEGQSFETVTQNRTTYHHNGNNVDIDKEMSELAQNQIYYNSLVERLNGKFQSLQNVIRGGN